jgi:hypothetical protein
MGNELGDALYTCSMIELSWLKLALSSCRRKPESSDRKVQKALDDRHAPL